VKLRLPAGATVDGSGEVVVNVRIEPALGQRNFEIAVQTGDLKQGLAVTLAPDGVTVTVAGSLPVLDALAGDAITARIDLADVTPGTYQLSPKIELPANVELIVVTPSDIQVTVSAQ
jgi:YbbR domain-containing protein